MTIRRTDDDTRSIKRRKADDEVRQQAEEARQWRFFNAYQEFTDNTAVYPGAGSGSFEAVVYCALKSGGECGEFQEKLGKWMRKQGGIDALSVENMPEDLRLELAKELGDRMWYIAQTARVFGFTLSEIAEINVRKLSDRKTRGVIIGEGDNR